MTITTRIDWAGYTGDVGRVYILGWDNDEDKRGHVRITKTDVVIPLADCLNIARKQYGDGHIAKWEYDKIVGNISSKGAK
jgi:hypothetical protein